MYNLKKPRNAVSAGGQALATQVDVHAPWGGVVPSLAMEAHAAAMDDTVAAALTQAGIRAADLDAVAVTVGPGLALCLQARLPCPAEGSPERACRVLAWALWTSCAHAQFSSRAGWLEARAGRVLRQAAPKGAGRVVSCHPTHAIATSGNVDARSTHAGC